MIDTSGPFLVAHRAGNDLSRLRLAEELGVGLVEADLHLFAGRLEVRHLKRAGPLPILWDGWQLAPPWRRRLELRDLLAATRPDTELMLDLKGLDPRLARRVGDVLAAEPVPRRITVCARNWRLLGPLDGLANVRVVHSVRTRPELRGLWRRLDRRTVGGVSIHREILDAALVDRLRARTELLLSWPVESEEIARTLAGWGVQGLISQSFDRLAPLLRPGLAVA
jgi:glycerophosphoryl diester phosphodiesterase